MPRKLPRKLITRALLLSLLWWALAGGAPEAWKTGAVVILVALAASIRLQPDATGIAPLRLPAFLLFFLARSIKGGIQVAAIALRPRLRLRPVMLEIPLRLPDESERIFLAAIMSLLPGTLSAGLHGNCLSLHALDAGLPIEAEIRRAERQVARLFRTELP